MSFNGSGTFVINSAGQPVVTNTTISSTAFNALTADLATGLSTALTKDGQTAATANIPMGTKKLTGLGVGTANTDSITLGQSQAGGALFITAAGTADVITATGAPTITAYATGNSYYFTATGANTTNVTLNVDSLGAKAVTKNGSTALVAGDIPSGAEAHVVYDGTRFQLINPAGAGVTTWAGGTTGLTPAGATSGAVSLAGTLALTNGGTGGTSAATARTSLGLGTAAIVNTGTSGATIPLLNAANTWGAAQTFGAATAGTTITLSAQPWLLAASGTQTNVTGDNTNYTLLWASEIKDRGANFASPTWTAPLTGCYLVCGVLQLSGQAATDTTALMTVVATSRTINLFQINPGVALVLGNVEMPFATTIDMTAADTLVTKIQVNGTSGKTTDIEEDSRLSIVFLG